MSAESAAKDLAFQSMNLTVKYAITELTMYGAYLLLFTSAVWSTIQPARKSTRGRVLLSGLFLSFVLLTTQCCLDIATLLAQLHALLSPEDTAQPLDGFLQSKSNLSKAVSIVHWLVGGVGDTGALFLITDAVAAWRAITIWRIRRGHVAPTLSAVPLCLCALLLFNIGLWIPFVVLSERRTKLYESNTAAVGILMMTASLTSIAANALATWMIAYTAYDQMNIAASEAKSTKIRFDGARTLVLLAESGVLYVVIQIVRLALVLSLGPSTPFGGSLMTGQAVFHGFSAVLTAMYPPALVILIDRGFSVAEHFQTTTGVDGGRGNYNWSSTQTGNLSGSALP